VRLRAKSQVPENLSRVAWIQVQERQGVGYTAANSWGIRERDATRCGDRHKWKEDHYSVVDAIVKASGPRPFVRTIAYHKPIWGLSRPNTKQNRGTCMGFRAGHSDDAGEESTTVSTISSQKHSHEGGDGN